METQIGVANLPCMQCICLQCICIARSLQICPVASQPAPRPAAAPSTVGTPTLACSQPLPSLNRSASSLTRRLELSSSSGERWSRDTTSRKKSACNTGWVGGDGCMCVWMGVVVKMKGGTACRVGLVGECSQISH